MAEEVLTDAKTVWSWARHNLVKLHLGVLATGWGVFEWLAPKLANKVHLFVLHIFWGDFVHRIIHFVRGH